MSIGATVFAATYAALPDCQAQLRVGRKTVVACLVASVGGERVATDQGLAVTPDISARLPATSIPAGTLRIGDSAEVSRDAGATWTQYRIDGRTETAGLVRLTLMDPSNG